MEKWLWLLAGVIIGGAIVYAIRGRATIVHLERDGQGRVVAIVERVTW